MSAEEIESMCRQAEVDARAMAASKWQHGEWAAGQLRMMAKTVVTLSAELAKAREALALIAEPLDGCPDVPKYYDSVRAFEIARAALAAKGPTNE